MKYYANGIIAQYVCLLVILMLTCSCRTEPPQITDAPFPVHKETIEAGSGSIQDFMPESEMDTPETIIPETEPPKAELIIETEAETAEIPGETVPMPEIPETSAETEPLSEPEPLVPPELPDDLHTNIEDPAALYILLDIYEAISASSDAGMYFTDAEEQYWFGIGEEKRYHTASTIKPVYCQYLLAGGIDLETEITLQQVSRTSSTGNLNWDDIGTTFTAGELIEYSIRYSDNQAHRLLYETFGIEDYNTYVANFGSGGLPMDEVYEWSNVTPLKLSRVMLEIYRYSAENSILIDHLKNTTFNRQISAGTKYETAHKYGSNGGADGYHDTAIVYADERAYVLTIMTHIDIAQTEDENAVFRRTAELCDELHAALFNE